MILSNIASGCSVGGVFATEVILLLLKVKPAVKIVKFMTRDLADKYMISKELDIKTILKGLVSSYTHMRVESEWYPANAPRDRSAIKSINMIASATPGSVDYAELTKNLIATLQFNGGARPDPGAKKTPSTHPCHNCNKLGYWSPNCPEPRKTTGTPFTGNPNPNHSRPRSQDNGNVTSQDGKPLHWRRVPPAVGESETKKQANVSYYWCSKCRNWNKTHVTASHVRRPVGSSNNCQKAANLVLDPGAWIAKVEEPIVSSYDGLGLLILLPVIYFAMVFILIPKYGLSKSVCLLGLLHSFKDFGISVTSMVQSLFIALSSAAKTFTSEFALAIASSKLLPWTSFLAPSLWILLFAIITIWDKTDHSSAKDSRAFCRSYSADIKRYKSKLSKFRKTFHAPHLRERSYHRPHQKPRSLAPPT